MYSMSFRPLAVCCAFLLFSSLHPALADDAPMHSSDQAMAEDQSIQGTVTETMDSSGYTYLLVNTGQQKIWVAIPEATVTAGQEVTCRPGMEMVEFTSKTLNRTFDSIIFSPGLAGNAAAAMKVVSSPQDTATPASKETIEDDSFAQALQAEQQQAQNPHGTQPMGQSVGSIGAVVPMAEIQVEKAAAENSYSVEECFEQAAKLDGTDIVVRGKVMKVSPRIMGRNWVHIQDGSGNPMNNSHDLVVTTQDMPKQGSIVTVNGTLHAKRDFGAGYKYAAIVEDASIQ